MNLIIILNTKHLRTSKVFKVYSKVFNCSVDPKNFSSAKVAQEMCD